MADSQADAVQTPIIMKVDSPSEEHEPEDNEANANNDIGHACSPAPRTIIQSSRFGNPFAPKLPSTSMSLPGASSSFSPAPSTTATGSKAFALNPSKLNPFLKVTTTEDKEQGKVECSNGETPQFVPLLTTTSEKTEDKITTTTTSRPQVRAQSSAANFIFGQNLQARVMKDACPAGGKGDASSSDECKPSSSTNGTSTDSKEEMLFSSAIKDTPHTQLTSSKTLNESAREYEEQRNNKRKYEEVETKTGEEDETNVMQISCKLFAFDKAIGNWQERGRGTLRLNDQLVKDDDDASFTQSRLVFRTSGVHKVILNTKIWAEMTVEQASAKSLRLTAIDAAGEIKVYLVMASPDEVKHLFKCLQERRTNEQKRHNLKKLATDAAPNSTTTTSTTMETSADECEVTNSNGNNEHEQEVQETTITQSTSTSNLDNGEN